MIRILYDNIIFDMQYAGGISKIWYNLISRMPLYFNINYVESAEPKNIFRKKIKLDFENLIYEKNRIIKYKQYKKVINNDCDIYHSSYFRPLKQKKRSKVVVTVHDFMYEKYGTFLAKKNHLFLKNRSIDQADAIICVSNHTKKDFLNYYPRIDEGIVHVVYNGVDDEFRPVQKMDLIKINNLEIKREKYLLYVGNRGYCKNFDFVLKLMKTKTVNDLGLVLICVGGGRFNKKELNYLSKNKLELKVHLLDKVEASDLNDLYNHAFSLLFPSIYEGFGIPVLEAMKAGCPVWSTNSSSVSEVIGNDYPFMFSPTNWNEAYESFVNLLDPRLRAASIELGYENAAKFSWDKCADETFNIYKLLMKK
jgi:glycosyltransferase involved in cell wall biosynthesis